MQDKLFQIICHIRTFSNNDMKMLDHVAHELGLDEDEKQSCIYRGEVSSEELTHFIIKKLTK